MGEANGVGIRTWAKVEMEKLSNFSISGIKDNCPGLALVLKKKKSAISIGTQSSEFIFRQENSEIIKLIEQR